MLKTEYFVQEDMNEMLRTAKESISDIQNALNTVEKEPTEANYKLLDNVLYDVFSDIKDVITEIQERRESRQSRARWALEEANRRRNKLATEYGV